MASFRWQLLPPLHQAILNEVKGYPGQFTRSELAKIAIGSTSVRVSEYRGLQGFGKLSEFGRKVITEEIDILVQQKFLALDQQSKLILGEMSYSVGVDDSD